ncbi:hypothetical protein JTE90_011289 [Oedothorax gibbosus]|uniref:Uncharacterized protein n=1 Tax=Oedothorax gibbosus TaxID=931172 RepID=A0AAV6VNN4_9ARAC|nr:hypothetical protein JTE90_011289 [Oedothorax gibbosus]
MDFSLVFVELYQSVLGKEKNFFYVEDERIRAAIQNMKEVYMPNPLWQANPALTVADYNDPSHRCAYLHKYAMCYTGMVCDLLQGAISESNDIYELINSKRRLRLCSLGGGPGTDVLGSLAAIFACCQYIPCSVSVLDFYAQQWKITFDMLIKELRSGVSHGLKEMVSAPQFKYEFMYANLLSDVETNPQVRQIVSAADIITMVKFISAAACQATSRMVQAVFNSMQPGAMLIFIDNAAGGFQEMVQQAALQCGMLTLYGPLLHHDYENANYSLNRFSYTSQSKTKVAFHIWWKPYTSSNNTTRGLRNDFFSYNRLHEQGEQNVRVSRPKNRSRSKNRNRSRNRSRGRQQEQDAEGGCCSII